MPLPKLEDLPDDVLLYLLPFCDISSVLSISQTCRYYHLLSQDRQLWVALLETLTHKLFRDPLPDENRQSLGTRELVALAKRAARGPETWVDPSPVSLPTFVREVRVPCAMVHHANFFAGRAALLPGGQYVALSYRTAFMLLNAANTGGLLGAHEAREGAHIHDFSAVVAADRNSVDVVLHTELFAVPRKRGLEIVRFSLRTEGEIEAPLALYVRKDLFNEGFWHDPQICGAHASIVIFNKPGWMVLLVDWATSSYILVNVSQRPHTSMIPGHLVLATCSSESCIEISVLDIASLREHWQPIRSMNWGPAISNAPPLSTLPTIFFETVSLNPGTFAEPLPFRLSVYESPLENRKFNIHLHVPCNTHQAASRPRDRWRIQKSKRLPDPSEILFSFVLTLPCNPTVMYSWRRREPVPLSLPACFPDFYYAVNGMPQSQVPTAVIAGAPLPKPVTLSVLTGRHHVSRSVYSGALTLVAPSEIVVRYYW